MQQDSDHTTIIDIERNAWRSDPADKVGFIIDAAQYYRSLQEILPKARKTIWIIGWDFNPDIYLDPERPDATLGAFLRSHVDQNPDLEIRILVWAMGPIYSGKSLSLFSEDTWSASICDSIASTRFAGRTIRRSWSSMTPLLSSVAST